MVWPMIIAAAVSAIGAKKQGDADAESAAGDKAFNREQDRRQRTQALQDRIYKEDAIASYGDQFYTGPPVKRPERTNMQALFAEEDAIAAPLVAASAPPKKPGGFFRRALDPAGLFG